MASVDKTAIVTGAGAGIGRACALRCARGRYSVVVNDRQADAAHRTSELIREQGGEAVPVVGDVSEAAHCGTLAQSAIERWGRIDLLIANAGIQTPGSLLEATEQDIDRVLAVNLKGAAFSCQAVLPQMILQRSGAIVLIASVNALRGSPGMAAYDMSKAGVLGLMRSLASEHGGHGVRVNAVCPGNTITDFHLDRMALKGIDADQLREMTRGYGLLGRAAEPSEIAKAVFFLGGDESSFVTGHALVVDGGFSVCGK